jgi:hypothetical protein
MPNKTDDFARKSIESTDEASRDSGSDIPGGTGVVSDEDIQAIGQKSAEGKPTGQDRSTENYEETIPTHGVAGAQNHADTTSDIACIED